jgi:hypothetical protein
LRGKLNLIHISCLVLCAQSKTARMFGKVVAAGGLSALSWTVFSKKEDKEKDKPAPAPPARGKGIKIFTGERFAPLLAFLHMILTLVVADAGNAHKALATEICDLLDVPLGKAEVARFANGETNVTSTQQPFSPNPIVRCRAHCALVCVVRAVVLQLARASATAYVAARLLCGSPRCLKPHSDSSSPIRV